MTRPSLEPAVVQALDAPIPLAAAAPADAQGNAFHVVQRLLRGRLLLTIALAAVGSVIGAAAGYLAVKPKYQTIGLVNVRPVLDQTIYQTELSVPMQYFTNFVNKQVALLKSGRVMAHAMQSDAWRALGQGQGAAAEKKLRRTLKVEAPRESPELIEVTCVDEDPAFTSAVVAEIIKSYEYLFPNEGSIDPNTIKMIEAELRDCQIAIDGYEKQIRTATESAGLGTEDLTKEHAARHTRVLELESRVQELALQLGEAGALNPDGSLINPPAEATPPPVSALSIANGGDLPMQALLAREIDLERTLSSLEAQGFLANHPEVRRIRGEFAGTKTAIDKRVADWVASGGAPMVSDAAVRPGETVEQRKARYQNLLTILKSSRAELERIDGARAGIDRLVREKTFKEEEKKTISQRLRALQVEATGPDQSRERIKVMSYGETPGFPSVDKRKQLAALGFLAGGGIPVGLMLLLGFVDRRFRYSDQADELRAAPPLLGILPILPRDLDNPEQRAIAAHCVHQVRLLLQIGGAASGRKVYAITSPTAGDGKTSLALSLGLSFSAAGSRTLLIDFDMIGTGLTSNLRLENGTGSAPHGLVDALRTGELNGSRLAIASERLWVIPSLPEDEHFVSRVSAQSVKRLLNQVRDAYDVVIVDTGPMLGSLEASLVCAEADGVIMVVGRGQRRDHIEQALSGVNAVNGRVVGMVFNRATPGDFRRSVSSTSMRSVPRALPAPEPGHRPGADRLEAAGPVVRTIALEIDAQADASGTPRLQFDQPPSNP